MNRTPAAPATPVTHLLRFRSLYDEGRGYAFPCDAEGRVDIDALGRTALVNYLFARGVVGREFGMPAVEPLAH